MEDKNNDAAFCCFSSKHNAMRDLIKKLVRVLEKYNCFELYKHYQFLGFVLRKSLSGRNVVDGG